MARANPRLKRFTITRLPRRAQLPLRLPSSRWTCFDPFCDGADEVLDALAPETERSDVDDELLVPLGPVDQLGALSSTTYTLVRDPHGIPVRLDVHELRSALRVRVPIPSVIKPMPYAAGLAGLSVPSLFELSSPGSPLAAWVGKWLDWPPATVVRRYVHDLRPPGHPGLPQKRWMELVLADHTAAGEEARLLLFCMVLGGVAAWTSVNCLSH
jgi:hypothetical protein